MPIGLDHSPLAHGRWPALLLLLIGSIGVPGTAVAFFRETIATHPNRALLLLLAWEILFFGGAFIARIWERLESRWVDRLADNFDRWLSRLISRYERRYLDWVYYQHRDLDVKGLSTQGVYNLEIANVFVDLAIQPTAAHAASPHPIRSIPHSLVGRRQIWDYLQSHEVVRHNLALIGPPGAGKTTLLKHVVLRLSRNRRRAQMKQTIPILLYLREHVEVIQKDQSASLTLIVARALARHQGPPPPEGWLDAHLAKGSALVLLDGLDEVAHPEDRWKVAEWVEAQTRAWPKSRFVVSSRPHGYKNNPLGGVLALEVQPFTSEQVQQFVSNWYRANEIRASGGLDPGVEMAATEGASDLLRRLRSSNTLMDLAVNPLLLTMIATVHRFRSSLPGRRVELYAEICEVFLGKRHQARGLAIGLTPGQRQRVLQPLAWQLMREKRRDITLHGAVKAISHSMMRVSGQTGEDACKSFLKDVENASGLLLEREANLWSFAHLAFQEYLAAVHAREEGLDRELVSHVGDPWWNEVLRLYGAQGDASPILEACLLPDFPTVEAMTLAMDCVEEAREVEPFWRERLDRLLVAGAESSEPERFRLSAECLLMRRVRGLVSAGNRVFVDPNPVTHAEYQLFLDETRNKGPLHWPPGNRFPSGSALTPVVGVSFLDAQNFCSWMTGRSSGGRFRLLILNELSTYSGIINRDPMPQIGHWVVGSSFGGGILEGARILDLNLDEFMDEIDWDEELRDPAKFSTAARQLLRDLGITDSANNVKGKREERTEVKKGYFNEDELYLVPVDDPYAEADYSIDLAIELSRYIAIASPNQISLLKIFKPGVNVLLADPTSAISRLREVRDTLIQFLEKSAATPWRFREKGLIEVVTFARTVSHGTSDSLPIKCLVLASFCLAVFTENDVMVSLSNDSLFLLRLSINELLHAASGKSAPRLISSSVFGPEGGRLRASLVDFYRDLIILGLQRSGVVKATEGIRLACNMYS